MELAPQRDRDFVEQIDTILSAGNPQGGCDYNRIAHMLLARDRGLRHRIAQEILDGVVTGKNCFFDDGIRVAVCIVKGQEPNATRQPPERSDGRLDAEVRP